MKSSSSGPKLKQDKSFKVFIALFEYDPYTMSPNQDSVDEELPFKEGQLIKVYGNPDADGYYYGECNGRFGFIPGNMIQEVDDPEVVRQVMSEAKKPSNSGSKSNITTSGSGGMSQSKQQQQQQGKMTSSSSKPGSKGQSFQPIEQPQYSKPPGKAQRMIALYDYDPQSLSPNPDTDVSVFSFFSVKFHLNIFFIRILYFINRPSFRSKQVTYSPFTARWTRTVSTWPS
jgi:RIMS-binding protein 2